MAGCPSCLCRKEASESDRIEAKVAEVKVQADESGSKTNCKLTESRSDGMVSFERSVSVDCER